MPRLHRYVHQSGFYIRARHGGTISTFQLTPTGEAKLHAAGFLDGDAISTAQLLVLIRSGEAYTGGSPAGSIDTQLVPAETEPLPPPPAIEVPFLTPILSDPAVSRTSVPWEAPMPEATTLTRIGVFYDGNFFFHVSNFYQYHHERRARISVAGLHNFIRQQVAESEGVNVRYCHIVDAHYFRGRLRAKEADERGLLLGERRFEDVLMREGVVTHFLPLRDGSEMGIDVWLALEAYELALLKKFDVSVLIAGDGDFLPLVRKLNTIGTRVMLLGWDFKYSDHHQQEKETRTAQVLLDEVTYPIQMHQIIDDRSRRTDPFVSNLFLQQRTATVDTTDRKTEAEPPAAPSVQAKRGKIKLPADRRGYGFIVPDEGGNDIFFFHENLRDVAYEDLNGGEPVRYVAGVQDDGRPVARRVELINA